MSMLNSTPSRPLTGPYGIDLILPALVVLADN
jgi:hypothetical protein